MTRILALGMASLSLALPAMTASSAQAKATAIQASFPCARAATVTERTICGDPELARLDRIMADLFTQTRGLLLNAEQSAQADTTQRAWLARRNRCAEVQCLRRAYFSRIADLARDLPNDG